MSQVPSEDGSQGENVDSSHRRVSPIDELLWKGVLAMMTPDQAHPDRDFVEYYDLDVDEFAGELGKLLVRLGVIKDPPFYVRLARHLRMRYRKCMAGLRRKE